MNGEETQQQRPPPLGRGRGAGLSLGAPRGRGGGRGATQEQQPTSSSSTLKDDAAIRSTDNDAVGSRIAAIQHHYIKSDPFTTLLGPSIPTNARPPIINIGTYLRCRAIDNLVENFLDQEGTTQKQFISLGAGSDSRYWRLQADSRNNGKLRHYVELDFPELTTSKIEKLIRHKDLLGAVTSEEGDVRISSERDSLQSASYSLLACDLRTLPSSPTIIEKLKGVLDPNVDTLILAECVLAYLLPESSTSLLRCLSSLLNRPFAICYEMCVAGDNKIETAAQPSKFGTVMLNNLQARNLSMPGAKAYSTVWSHAKRFEDVLGKEGRGTAKTLKQVWEGLDDNQRQRLSRLQGLDEVEELEILLSHYAISWYSCDASSTFLQTSL